MIHIALWNIWENGLCFNSRASSSKVKANHNPAPLLPRSSTSRAWDMSFFSTSNLCAPMVAIFADWWNQLACVFVYACNIGCTCELMHVQTKTTGFYFMAIANLMYMEHVNKYSKIIRTNIMQQVVSVGLPGLSFQQVWTIDRYGHIGNCAFHI